MIVENHHGKQITRHGKRIDKDEILAVETAHKHRERERGLKPPSLPLSSHFHHFHHFQVPIQLITHLLPSFFLLLKKKKNSLAQSWKEERHDHDEECASWCFLFAGSKCESPSSSSHHLLTFHLFQGSV